jgi:hypothetical protein
LSNVSDVIILSPNETITEMEGKPFYNTPTIRVLGPNGTALEGKLVIALITGDYS